MFYPNYCYVDTSYGGVDKRNKILKLSEIKLPDNPVDCYRTTFRFNEDFKVHVDQTGSVSKYSGTCYADYIPIDIDSANLKTAHDSAIRLLNTLLDDYEVDLDALYLFFSGAKGFHILIPSEMFNPKPSDNLNDIFKQMALSITKDIIKIDTAIYDKVRLFRMANTINSKSGLYKIPLSAGELLHLSVDDILDLAKTTRKRAILNDAATNHYLVALYNKAQEKKKTAPVSRSEFSAPKDAKKCYYAILQGITEGNRDNVGLRLAVHLLKEYPKDIVEPMMQAWNRRNIPPLEDDMVTKLVNQAEGLYDFGCNDEILKDYCSDTCRFKKIKQERVSAKNIYTIEEAKQKYEEYIAQLTKRKITFGFDKLDSTLRGIAPGEVCQVMARTGVGKTAFLLNVMKNVLDNQGVPVLFFSLEMPLAQIYERAVQITNSKSGQYVEQEFYKNKDNSLHTLTSISYDKLYTVDQDFLSYDELKEFILIAEKEKIGERPPLVCVDYLGRMQGSAKDNYSLVSELAKQLKLLAKELDIAVLYLHQTNRSGRTGQEEITLDMGRDSGVAEEAADFILGMWRPAINSADTQKESEEEIIISVLKNRKGMLGRTSFTFDKPTLRITQS